MSSFKIIFLFTKIQHSIFKIKGVVIVKLLKINNITKCIFCSKR